MAEEPEPKRSKSKDLTDETLGLLRHDQRLAWYRGSIRYQGRDVSFSLPTDASGGPAAFLPRAKKVLATLDDYAERAKAYAAEELLKVKNDSWLEEGQEKLTTAMFVERMRLDALSFDEDGGVAFYHQDGDLFWGHAIQVSMNAADCFVGAEIPG